MDLEYFNDQSFQSSELYLQFVKNNPGHGNLKIRAFAASEAVPIQGLHVIISTIVENEKIIFFEGDTDTSGMIETISLPTPSIDMNNMEVPNSIIYEIEAIDTSMNVDEHYEVRMYDGVCVVQNIGILPDWGNS